MPSLLPLRQLSPDLLRIQPTGGPPAGGSLINLTVAHLSEQSVQLGGSPLCIFGGKSKVAIPATVSSGAGSSLYVLCESPPLLRVTWQQPGSWCYSLLTTYHLLLTTHHPLLTTYNSLLTTHYSQLTTYNSLLTTHYSLLTTHYSQLTTYN